MSAKDGDSKEDVLEMFLCETEKLILQPNRLYRFRVNALCERCVSLEREGNPHVRPLP